MISALSGVLQSAASRVAPEVPFLQDFKHHWDLFLRYYVTKQPAQFKKEPIENTKLTFHLNRMLKVLVDEQETYEDDSMTTCVEYLLKHNILDVLVTLCQSDTPPGIRPYIFNVFIFLLDKIRHPILPQSRCHTPLRRLALVCTLTKASPTEGQEVKYLTMLCGKIRAKPELINIFLSSSSKIPMSCTPNSFASSRQSSHSSSSLDLANIEKLAINVNEVLDNLKTQHLLASALLNYLDSADYLLACTAMEALLIISGVNDDNAALILVRGSLFCSSISSRLLNLYRQIPSSIDASKLEGITVNWMEAHHFQPDESENLSFPGRTELVTFLSFFDYMDNIVRVAHPIVAQGLAGQIRHEFFEDILEPKLTSRGETWEKDVSWTAAMVALCWQHVQSDRMAEAMSCWLLGDSDGEVSRLTPNGLQQHIISLCRHENLEVSHEVLRMMDIILLSPCEYILSKLVTTNLESRGYVQQDASEFQINSWSEEEDEREKHRPIERIGAGMAPSRTLAPSNIHRVVNAWLYLVPDQLRLDEARGSGYDHYVTDATTQVKAVNDMCSAFAWPREATALEPEDTSSADSRIEADRDKQFFEGEFLSMLFDLMSSVLDNDYDTNLLVTSLLSRLCQLPHPHLHEYLLNPSIPLQPGTRSLHGLLKTILVSAQARAEKVPNFQHKMTSCRRRLLGDLMVEDSSLTRGLQNREETVLLEAILVLEEFCKELAAVNFVKYHCNS